MEYVRLDDADGGQLWVTRMGWPRLPHLLPEHWHANNTFAVQGQRLKNATAAAYRLASKVDGRQPFDLVIKFARIAQDVPIWIDDSCQNQEDIQAAGNIRFNSPFEEFGLVSQLRRKRYEPGGLPVVTGRPLAIYSPPDQRPLWQLGRTKQRFRLHQRALLQHTHLQTAEDAPHFFELHADREYILIYEWLKGIDGEQALEQGHITEAGLKQLTQHAIDTLAHNGFAILDHKPRHLILRHPHPHPHPRKLAQGVSEAFAYKQKRSNPAASKHHNPNRKLIGLDGKPIQIQSTPKPTFPSSTTIKTQDLLRRHDGELAYGLIDFELMVPKPRTH